MLKRYNWGKYNSWHPRKALYPSSLDELQLIVAKAKENHEKIRIAGSLHSMNAICETSEIQVHTDKLDKILQIDKARKTVRTEGGIKIYTLLEILAHEGLTLPNQGYITDQSIAGAISTATHGSGKTGTLSSFVEEIELVDGQGKIHHLTPASNPHLFSAAVVSLGCLGIIYALTLRCIPLEKLRLSKLRTNRASLAPKFSEVIKEEYFQFALDPYSDEIIQWQYSKTTEAIQNRWKYLLNWLLIKSFAICTLDIMPTPYWLLPHLLKIYFAASPIKNCIDYSYKLLSPADEGHYIEEEIAVPQVYFGQALAETRWIIDQFRKQKKCFVAIILLRFADADPYGYLSPAKGRQTGYISLITIAKKGYKELFQEFENSMYKFQGKPHWGKEHSLTKEKASQLYGEDYIKFVEAKKELDPAGIFSNAYIDTLF